eukprot:CAMPEP_0172070872 /NCGR_PEP_ID=MMETSP1043-20130122/13489_1 /TAXON_ID=464988 /ORGANISM="Hemiselmis andersenii, Strain CCMP441" /LENGTH=215 /DNA_ID=CAMNT_0012731253 /DNA_START=161 /DNA_END=804 /DNA_ORIENTATION=+
MSGPASRRALGLVLVAATLQGAMGDLESCLLDPSAAACEDGNALYPHSSIASDLSAVCMSTPHNTGCSVRKQCISGAASGPFCGHWSLLAAVCASAGDEEGCSTYNTLCTPPGGAATAVKECGASPAPQGLPSAEGAWGDLELLCREMPDMLPCLETCTAYDSESCPDPLLSLSNVCSDHYMVDCEGWWGMCQYKPPGLVPFCGASVAIEVEEGG